MRRALILATVIAWLLAAVSPTAGQAVVLPTLYDGFDARRINPEKWRVFVQNHPRVAELAVEQVSGRLKMELQAYGAVGAPSPGDVAGLLQLEMTDGPGNAARGIQVTTRIEDYEITGCGSSPAGRSDVQLIARLFRAGSNPNPGNPHDLTNVVDAIFRLSARPTLPRNTLTVSYFAFMFLNSDGTDAVDFGDGSFVNATLDQNITLGIELDTSNNRIIFTMNSETMQTISYSPTIVETFTDTRLLKFMVVRHRLERCPVAATGWIKATSDNFRTTP